MIPADTSTQPAASTEHLLQHTTEHRSSYTTTTHILNYRMPPTNKTGFHPHFLFKSKVCDQKGACDVSTCHSAGPNYPPFRPSFPSAGSIQMMQKRHRDVLACQKPHVPELQVAPSDPVGFQLCVTMKAVCFHYFQFSTPTQ